MPFLRPSPGVAFLVKVLPGALLPAVIVFAVSSFFSADIHPLLIALSAPLIWFAKSQWTQWGYRKEMRAMGAIPVPIVKGKFPGNVDLLWKAMVGDWANGYPWEALFEAVHQYGKTVNIRVLGQDHMFSIEPEVIKTILSTDFNNYEKGASFAGMLESFLGVGVFNSDGDMWKFHRGMTRPYFIRDRISDFDIFNRHSDEAILKAKKALRQYPGMALDFQDLVSQFTLDSATEFLFGSCVHSLKQPIVHAKNSPYYTATTHSADSDRFAKAFNDVQIIAIRRVRMGAVWPMLEIFGDAVKKPMKVINAYIQPIIEEAMKKKSAMKGSDKETAEPETLLDHLIRSTDDPKIIRDELLNILLAGRDTTAATLTFAVYLLAMHPDVAKKLRMEVLRVVGNTKVPTYEDIRELKYMRAVINETLRLFPPVPANWRDSVNSTTWTVGDGTRYYIPPRTNTPYSVMIMQRCTDYWGPDANEFDPERFLDERVKDLTKNPFVFLPFNGGPRICLGQQFAYNELSFFLVKLLQTFDEFTLRPDAQPEGTTVPARWANAKVIGRQPKEKIFPRTYLTMSAHGGMWVSLKEAAPAEGV